MASHLADPLGLGCVSAKFRRQPRHGGGAQIGLFLLAVNQVVQHAVAQRALCGLHLVDLQQVKHRTQHTDTAANHSAAVVFHAFQLQAVHGLGFQQLVQQPVQPGPRDDAWRKT